MKVEIDLNDIFAGDDEGRGETLQESIRRQVVDSLTATMKKGLQRKIDEETSRILNEQLRSVLVDRMPEIVNDILTTEYTPVDRYGSREAKPTTFRTQLVTAIHENMAYKPKGNSYSGDRNAFSKAVDDVIEAKMSEFKSAYLKQVDAQFVADAMQFAASKLAERLGVKKAA